MKIFQKELNKPSSFIVKLLFVLSCILFALPSVVYYLKYKTVFQFENWFQFLLNDTDRFNQTLLYVILLLAMTLLYLYIVKNRKSLFQTTNKMFGFIAIIAMIFVAVIPFTCSDVFYYLGIGRIDSTYHQNPYYITIKDFVEEGNHREYLEQDTVLAQGYINSWSNSTVVYGPIWTFICKIIAGLSFGNIDMGLLLFKLINVMVHLLNCYLIYKISNKKTFTLLYALNPFILIEGIACVHNDMFIILFTLASFYFLLKKNNILWSIVFLVFATAIKYFTILLLPFLVLYYVRKEKPSKRLLACILYGLLFLFLLAICYLLYIQDISVFSGLFIQQQKLGKNFYIILHEYFTTPAGLVKTVNKTFLDSFVIIYFTACIILLNKKQIIFRKEMQTACYFILAFLFLLITNFQPWYIMWLFPCLLWQKPEDIRLIIRNFFD